MVRITEDFWRTSSRARLRASIRRCSMSLFVVNAVACCWAPGAPIALTADPRAITSGIDALRIGALTAACEITCEVVPGSTGGTPLPAQSVQQHCFESWVPTFAKRATMATPPKTGAAATSNFRPTAGFLPKTSVMRAKPPAMVMGDRTMLALCGSILPVEGDMGTPWGVTLGVTFVTPITCMGQKCLWLTFEV